jgi:hypothetical protein
MTESLFMHPDGTLSYNEPVIESNKPTPIQLFRLIEIAHETGDPRIRDAALALFNWLSKTPFISTEHEPFQPAEP